MIDEKELKHFIKYWRRNKWIWSNYHRSIAIRLSKGQSIVDIHNHIVTNNQNIKFPQHPSLRTYINRFIKNNK